MTDSHFLNDLNDLDLNDRFFTFLRLPSMRIFLFYYVSAIKFCQEMIESIIHQPLTSFSA